jgi:hypothetical protein
MLSVFVYSLAWQQAGAGAQPGRPWLLPRRLPQQASMPAQTRGMSRRFSLYVEMFWPHLRTRRNSLQDDFFKMTIFIHKCKRTSTEKILSMFTYICDDFFWKICMFYVICMTSMMYMHVWSLRTFVCMYDLYDIHVCNTYVCMIYIYVCMYVCMYVWMHVCTYTRMYVWSVSMICVWSVCMYIWTVCLICVYDW